MVRHLILPGKRQATLWTFFLTCADFWRTLNDTKYHLWSGHSADTGKGRLIMTERLTDKIVKALPPARERQQALLRQRGEGLRGAVTAAGARGFVLNYRARGRELATRMGSFPPRWSAAAAPKEGRYEEADR